MPASIHEGHNWGGHPTLPGYYQCQGCGLVRTPWSGTQPHLPPPVGAASVVEDAPLPVGDPKGWPWVHRPAPDSAVTNDDLYVPRVEDTAPGQGAEYGAVTILIPTSGHTATRTKMPRATAQALLHALERYLEVIK